MRPGDRGELLALLRRRSVRFGTFTLTSGATSEVYVDVRLTTLGSEGAGRVGRVLLDAMDRAGFRPQAVGGLEAGAIALTTAVTIAAAEEGRPLEGFFVRKAAREHGRRRRIEGIEEPSGDAVILEDTATTGGSTLSAVEAAREAGFRVIGAVALVDRETGAAARLEEAGVPFRAVFTLTELTANRPR